MAAVRIACLILPLFPPAARLRSEPELAREALVGVEGNGNAPPLGAPHRPSPGAGVKPRPTLPPPLARLAPDADLAATLERWGVRTVGDFAKLPQARVSSRLGQRGRDLHATARGIDPQPLIPHEPPPVFSEGMNLEWPLVSLEPFL